MRFLLIVLSLFSLTLSATTYARDNGRPVAPSYQNLHDNFYTFTLGSGSQCNVINYSISLNNGKYSPLALASNIQGPINSVTYMVTFGSESATCELNGLENTRVLTGALPALTSSGSNAVLCANTTPRMRYSGQYASGKTTVTSYVLIFPAVQCQFIY